MYYISLFLVHILEVTKSVTRWCWKICKKIFQGRTPFGFHRLGYPCTPSQISDYQAITYTNRPFCAVRVMSIYKNGSFMQHFITFWNIFLQRFHFETFCRLCFIRPGGRFFLPGSRPESWSVSGFRSCQASGFCHHQRPRPAKYGSLSRNRQNLEPASIKKVQYFL